VVLDPRPADRWPARTDAEARKRYRTLLQQALSAVHLTAQWGIVPVAEDIHSALVVPDSLLLLAGDREPVYLRATQRFQYGPHPKYPGERKVITAEYAYTLAADEGLREELVAWHWQQGAAWPHPHLHVRGEKPHIPTGRVAFEEVLLYAITDLGVTPARNDAVDVLQETLRRFKAHQSWS
jgi:hypothetical protein